MPASSEIDMGHILGEQEKNRKQSGGGYYQKIQHQIIISSVLFVEGGIKIMNFGMAKYIVVKHLI